MTEIVQQWKALPEVERRDFEDRATEEQKRYLAACIKERQERCTADEAVEEEGDEPTMGAEELAVQLPLARITKANPALSPTPPSLCLHASAVPDICTSSVAAIAD